MVKHYCDKCDKVVVANQMVSVTMRYRMNNQAIPLPNYDANRDEHYTELCVQCAEELCGAVGKHL